MPENGLVWGYPPNFHPKISVSQKTQNSLKWILNTTLKKITFLIFLTPPPPKMTNVNFFLMKASLTLQNQDTKC